MVPTAFFKLLYGLVILGHERRRLIGFGVTAHPSAEWIARQVTEAFPWDEAPRFLIRDRDGAFGPAYTRRIRAMGIRDRPTAARSPWQNGHARRGGASRTPMAQPAGTLMIAFDGAPLAGFLHNSWCRCSGRLDWRRLAK